MKNRYINAVYTNLILERDYEPVRRTDSMVIFPVLQKYNRDTYFVLQLLDGDLLNEAVIEEKLQADYNLLITGDYHQIFHLIAVFVFTDLPDPGKVAAIENGLNNKSVDKKHFSCYVVNMAGKEISKINRTPLSQSEVEPILRANMKDLGPEFESEPDIDRLLSLREKEYNIDFKARKPFLTYTLIGINVIVWLILYFYSQIKNISYDNLNIIIGAKENWLIMAGEYWRLITPVFLHDGRNILHLTLNCYSLYVVGNIVERIYGHYKFAIVYFLAGIFGSIASFIFSINPSIGASGAIFGLLGALIYYGIEKPKIYKKYFGYNVFVVLLINIGIGFSIPGIDNFGHLGGLTGGFLAAYAIKVRENNAGFINRVLRFGLLILIVIFGLYFGFHTSQNITYYKFNRFLTQQRFNIKDAKEAEITGEKMIGLSNGNLLLRAKALLLVVQTEIIQQKYEEAEEHAVSLKEISPFYGHYFLGRIYYYNGDYIKAGEELKAAQNINPNDPDLQKALKDIGIQ